MKTETKTSLNDETLSALQELIQINIDSRDGFQEVAEKTDDATISAMFTELSQQRGRQAADLQALVDANGKDPKNSGSTAAAAHRFLIDIRAAFGGGTAAMLAEAEKGEDKIKEKYEEVLKSEPGSAVSDVLHRHYRDVKAAHDRVRDTRDAYKEQ